MGESHLKRELGLLHATMLGIGGEERFHIFEVCASLSRYIASLLMATAAVSTFLFLQFFMRDNMFSTPLLKLVFIIAIGFIGIVNIVCGLVFLSKE